MAECVLSQHSVAMTNYLGKSTKKDQRFISQLQKFVSVGSVVFKPVVSQNSMAEPNCLPYSGQEAKIRSEKSQDKTHPLGA